jgi:hypothetical protein
LQRIEACYHAALAVPPGARAAYLADACAEDDALRREVESLLAADPGPGPRHVVSTDGGIQPAWSRDGRELFYTSLPQSPDEPIKMMAVPVTLSAEFKAGVPRMLF